MKKILLCSNTEGTITPVENILVSSGDFDIRICERGIDEAVPMAEAEKPDLLIVSIGDLAENTYMSVLKLQTGIPGMAILAYGETLEYTDFLSKYVGGTIHQLEKPLVPEKAIATIGRALLMSDEEIHAMQERNSSETKNGKRLILLVDDNAISLRSIKAMLQEDYRVSVVTSGEAALKFIRTLAPDIILLDYEMPGMDGREVLAEIRRDKSLSSIKVIFLTGINDKEHISSAMALKPEGYLLKPIEKKPLYAAIEAALMGKSANLFI